MKMLVTLEACHTAEGLAKSCQRHAEGWPNPCTVGLYFDCPFETNFRCQWVKTSDWEAVMKDVPEEGADGRDRDAD